MLLFYIFMLVTIARIRFFLAGTYGDYKIER